MPDYDFLNLSPVDFENLSRDLIQQKEGIFLESFGEGKDQGIDFRKESNENGLLIVQSKRYKNFADLISVLKNEELDKVKNKSPDRYILVTAASLNPEQKDKIFRLFHPYIKKLGDILGKEDLNNLLNSYPKIEEQNYKLWMTSANVLQTILNCNVINRSEILKEGILEDLKFFVQNESLNEAIGVLNEHNIVIISGIPGIGKTTLAKMLIYELMSKNYELIEISTDVDEGFKSFEKEKPQIFFYDDFMGRNFLGEGNLKNEEKRLSQFMKYINKSTQKKLIMTTREYILNQAKLQFDLIDTNEVNKSKFILDLSKYSNLVKAEILYNHLYFSGLPKEYIKIILKEKTYKRIIEHPNYNPRVIEAMTTNLYTKGIDATEYKNLFLDNLENSEKIWEHAFENQINKLAQYILYALLLEKRSIWSKNHIEVNDLMEFCKRFYREIEGENYKGLYIDFKKSLKELENTFISIESSKNRIENFTIIYFQNPSIKDFLLNYLRKNQFFVEALIKIADSSDQLFGSFKIKNNNLYINVQAKE